MSHSLICWSQSFSLRLGRFGVRGVDVRRLLWVDWVSSFSGSYVIWKSLVGKKNRKEDVMEHTSTTSFLYRREGVPHTQEGERKKKEG